MGLCVRGIGVTFTRCHIKGLMDGVISMILDQISPFRRFKVSFTADPGTM